MLSLTCCMWLCDDLAHRLRAQVVMTDLQGNELVSGGRSARLFLRIDPAHPERLDLGAAAVNSFSTERWAELETVRTISECSI